MNKKAFIGATLVTATVVGGLVYYRHEIRAQVARLLDPECEHQVPNIFPEARGMTDEEAAAFGEALKQQARVYAAGRERNHPSS